MRTKNFAIETLLSILAASVATGSVLNAAEFTGDRLIIKDFLALPRMGQYGRVPIHTDLVQAALGKGSWRAPQAGETVMSTEGKLVAWSAIAADDEGWIEGEALRGGYAYAQVSAEKEDVVLLEASGHAMVFVNGEPRAGDPYLTGRTILPIQLKSGKNDLLFHAAAGKLRARLRIPAQEVFLDPRDVTVPTLVRGEREPVWLGVLLVNSRPTSLTEMQVATQAEHGDKLTAKVDSVPPLGVRKVAIPLLPPDWSKVATDATELDVTISLTLNNEPATLELKLAIANHNQPQTRTYRSAIDGSVQEYRLLPGKSDNTEESQGMLVTLHDAGETATSHLDQFESQPGVHLLAPSGRRAEGCDWEDWSARDVLESLDDAAKHVKVDQRRVWLRGTGAGGHGVLRLGGIAADRWAALVPREPWLEYPAGPEVTSGTTIQEMLERIAWSDRLTPLLRNATACAMLLQSNVDSHGSNEIRELLQAFHPKFETKSVEGSAISLSEVLEFCGRHTAPDTATVQEVDCVTYNPGENSRIHWLTILSQQEMGSLSRAAVRFDQENNLIAGLTMNVAALQIDVSHLADDTIVEVVLDGEPVGEFAVEDRPLTFLRNEAGWQLVPSLPPSFKQPRRYGGLRSAFAKNTALVYGTRGTLAERSWALAKARYDAETILVRMNGSVDVVADTAFNANEDRDRNVVLYGNADTNSVWPQLMSTSSVQMRRDGVWIDRRPEQGEGLSCVFLRPRRGSDKAVVGAIGGNDIAGMRATDRLPYFVNGVTFPDLMLFSAESLTEGDADVRAAGYFGRVWTVDPGEIVWRDSAL